MLPALALLLVVTGCAPASPTARIETDPAASRTDQPIALRVTGLAPGTTTDLRATSTDANGVAWSSATTFTADDHGVVDPTVAAATGGSYLGTEAMGAITEMRPTDPAAEVAFYTFPAVGPATFALTARVGDREVAAATVTRTQFDQAPVRRALTVTEDGFSGVFVAPAAGGSAPAVLVLGGSEGGNSGVGLATALAARGIPALSVAYFRSPGLPRDLAKIPLEYFRTPLRWLRDQPGVDPERVWVSGASRGSEAAALLGVTYPDLVHGVIGLAPSNTVSCGIVTGQETSCPGPAWTRGGRAVPYTRQFNSAAPTDTPAAVIPIEKVDGPVLAVCGGADLEWSSCILGQALMDRLAAHQVDQPRLLLSYPDAGHYVDLLTPYVPVNLAADNRGHGVTAVDNPNAWADAWPKVVAFILDH